MDDTHKRLLEVFALLAEQTATRVAAQEALLQSLILSHPQPTALAVQLAQRMNAIEKGAEHQNDARKLAAHNVLRACDDYVQAISARIPFRPC